MEEHFKSGKHEREYFCRRAGNNVSGAQAVIYNEAGCDLNPVGNPEQGELLCLSEAASWHERESFSFKVIPSEMPQNPSVPCLSGRIK